MDGSRQKTARLAADVSDQQQPLEIVVETVKLKTKKKRSQRLDIQSNPH